MTHGPPKPAEHAEHQLIHLILSGTYQPGAALPGERELATHLGVTRPTLREALQRLSRDGWVRIQHGKATRVSDYMLEGGLAVLARLADHGNANDFIPHLLEIRAVLAPAYTRAAVTRSPGRVVDLLRTLPHDTADAYTRFDWHVHHELTRLSGNLIYSLILNGFSDLYARAARTYFTHSEARAASRAFYEALHGAAVHKDPGAAEAITRDVSVRSLQLWTARREEQP